MCGDGEAIYAPFKGKVVRRANPYTRGKKCINNGFLFESLDNEKWPGIHSLLQIKHRFNEIKSLIVLFWVSIGFRFHDEGVLR